jgi:peptide/nickel transport system ATP-binding protein
MQAKPLVVRDLTIHYYTLHGVVKAVRGVSFAVGRGESLCLVGESGSGKSTIGLAVLGALPSNARVVSGKILINGVNILELSEKELEEIRGKEISMIFQDPVASFNPLFTIGQVLSDIIKYKLGVRDKNEAKKLALKALSEVGLPDPERIYNSYPHELSGGMLQRAAIAVALATRPSILVADEPTTMLDVTLQAQILDLLQGLRRKLGLALLFITHNLGVVAAICDKVLVIYAGSVVEYGPVDEVLLSPLHPYTKRLIECVPRSSVKTSRLKYIPGSLPDLRKDYPGCIFAPRCSEALEKCSRIAPKFVEAKPGHFVACHKAVKAG